MKTIVVLFTLASLLFGCGKNLRPTCTITSPENGEEFELNEKITITVDADDIEGTFVEVHLYLDGIGVYYGSSPPHEYDWQTSNGDLGNHIFKAVAENNEGDTNTDSISIDVILIPQLTGSVTDIDGNNYDIITIGTQEWMAENLKTKNLNDGSSLKDATLEHNAPAYSYHNNDEKNGNTYGALYNRHAVATEKICPTGWHVPSYAEWETLINFLGGIYEAGGRMKATNLWRDPNEGATNESGFGALPGGYKDPSNTFKGVGEAGYFWTSAFSAISLHYHVPHVRAAANWEGLDLSIRCIKN